VRLGGRLIVGALVDEEGDMLGARHLCTTPIGRELSAAIVCEPEQNELCLEQRGVIWARVTARGRMAHGAMPEAGANPISALAALVTGASRLERRLRALCTRSRYLKPPTVTPTIMAAPVAGVPQSNVIPATAQATLDVRLTPGPDADAVAKEIDEACRRAADACPGVSVEWTPVNGFRMATRVERTEPLVRAMVGAVRRATGRPARWGGVPGSTDGTILRMELGIPIVTCGPGHRLIPHQVDEYVEVAELVGAARRGRRRVPGDPDASGQPRRRRLSGRRRGVAGDARRLLQASARPGAGRWRRGDGEAGPRAHRAAHRLSPRRPRLRMGLPRPRRALPRGRVRDLRDLSRGHAAPLRAHAQAVRDAPRARAGGRGLRRASRGVGRAGLLCRRAGAPHRALDRVPG